MQELKEPGVISVGNQMPVPSLFPGLPFQDFTPVPGGGMGTFVSGSVQTRAEQATVPAVPIFQPQQLCESTNSSKRKATANVGFVAAGTRSTQRR